jgi:hypothetical protein
MKTYFFITNVIVTWNLLTVFFKYYERLHFLLSFSVNSSFLVCAMMPSLPCLPVEL